MPLTLFRVGLNVLNLSRILGSDILFLLRPHRLVRSRTQGFHPWNRGSNPLGVMSSATPRSRSRRVSFCLMYFLLSATVFAESPPVSPSMLAEVPEHQDPRSSAMGTALSQAGWEAPIPPVPWGDAQIGASVQVQGRLIQLGGFPQPWRDLEEWFLQTQHGTLAVYMRVPSHRPELGSLIKIEGWRWPSVAVEGRGGARSLFPAVLAYGWSPQSQGIPIWVIPLVGTGLMLFLLHRARRWSRLTASTVAFGKAPRLIRLRADLPDDPAQALAALRDQAASPRDQEDPVCQANSPSTQEDDPRE